MNKYKRYKLKHTFKSICIICDKEFNCFKGYSGKYCNHKCQIKSLIGKKLSDCHKIKIGLGVKNSDKYREGLKTRKVEPNSSWFNFRNIKGKNHPQWKGGIQINKAGYILIHKPNHPYSNTKGYIFEHRIIMENYLGRYLKLEEVVHHINGIKTDNRIENLKLYDNQSLHIKENNQWKKMLFA